MEEAVANVCRKNTSSASKPSADKRPRVPGQFTPADPMAAQTAKALTCHPLLQDGGSIQEAWPASTLRPERSRGWVSELGSLRSAQRAFEGLDRGSKGFLNAEALGTFACE